MLRRAVFVITAALSTAAMPAHAAVNFVTNGSFSTTSATSSRQMSSSNGQTQYVSGWYNSQYSSSEAGYNFIVLGGQGGTSSTAAMSNSEGPVYFWSTLNDGSTTSNGYGVSPDGGNFLAADGAYKQGYIYQFINNLTVGKTYDLSFYYGAAQQHGFDGDTTEAWQVNFSNVNNLRDTQSFATPTITNPSHGFSGWYTANTSFVATATSEILSFLAAGTPSGKPPFSLLDGVTLNEHIPPQQIAAVPESGTWAMMVVGFGATGLAIRGRRRAKSSTTEQA